MGKELRLRRRADFKKAYKEGTRFLSPRFVLYMRENTLPQARIGISISKSHVKLATRRNRLRRIAKEVFREEMSRPFSGYDFVIASRRNCPNTNITEAVTELKKLLINIKR